MELPSFSDFLADRDADPEYWRRKAEWMRDGANRATDQERRMLLLEKAAEADRRWAALI